MDKQAFRAREAVDKKAGKREVDTYPQEDPLPHGHFSPALSIVHFTCKSSTCAVF